MSRRALSRPSRNTPWIRWCRPPRHRRRTMLAPLPNRRRKRNRRQSRSPNRRLDLAIPDIPVAPGARGAAVVRPPGANAIGRERRVRARRHPRLAADDAGPRRPTRTGDREAAPVEQRQSCRGAADPGRRDPGPRSERRFRRETGELSDPAHGLALPSIARFWSPTSTIESASTIEPGLKRRLRSAPAPTARAGTSGGGAASPRGARWRRDVPPCRNLCDARNHSQDKCGQARS